MTDRRHPVHGQSGKFSVNGGKGREGALLLYPDQLAAVAIGPLGTWIYVGVPPVYLAVEFFVFHQVGWAPVAIWSLCGLWVWQSLRQRRAAAKVADGRDDVLLIPLDQVTSVSCPRPPKTSGWLGMQTIVVATADGTEYTFHGMSGNWHDRLASALTAYGREVHVAPESITVLPWTTLGES